MKSVSILLSVIVGIASILLFRKELLDIAVATTGSVFNLTSSASDTTAGTDPKQQRDDHLYATDMSIPRAIRKVFLAVEQAEGAGARVRRSIGTPQLRNFSPFLMLGE